jgi:hypothetical protein
MASKDSRTFKSMPGKSGAKISTTQSTGRTMKDMPAKSGAKVPMTQTAKTTGNLKGTASTTDRSRTVNLKAPGVGTSTNIKPTGKAGAGAATDIVSHITNNYRVTAKEAGDIVKKVADYAKNSATQVGQASKAAVKSVASNYSPSTLAGAKGSSAQDKNNAAKANASKQAGQALGAVTQNRKYKD